ncbi:response regulator [Endothiovibrio diazotrophicus]
MTAVLAVDDEAGVRLNLVAYLEDEGFEVVEADSGERGLELLEGEGIEVAVVDMRMGGMDGNAFITEAHRRWPALRFIVFTGTAGYRLPPEVRAAGVSEAEVFIKPLSDMGRLAEAVVRLARGVGG